MFNEAIKEGGVAVITGAASGVGFAAAEALAGRGLDLVLVDLPGPALDEAASKLSNSGASVTAVGADVSDAEAMTALADQVFSLGPVAVLMNNAGIGRPTKSWEEPEHWRQMIEVNLFGVINGVQAFLPRMIDAARPAVVVNTGSKQGITNPPGNPGYNVTKAAVKTLTESLAHELRTAGAPISAHLFVPGFTYTGMIASFLPEKPPGAWTSEQTVNYLMARLEAGNFYVICPDNEVTPDEDKRRVTWSCQDITQNRPALSRWHPDFADDFANFKLD